MKLQAFEEMTKISRPSTPLCSASATIPIDRISERLPTRERMLGIRYAAPARLAKEIEFVSSTTPVKQLPTA